MTRVTIALAAGAAILGAGAAQAIEVHKTGSAAGAPAEVWARIGDFCAINDWHPAVTDCVAGEENGETYRTLTLGDGGIIKEKLIETAATSYTYEIVESPLPVQNYRSTFGVLEEAGATIVDWQGRFDAKGASDADAEAVIAGIYAAGLDQIKAMGQ